MRQRVFGKIFPKLPPLIGAGLTTAIAIYLYFKFDEKVLAELVLITIGVTCVFVYEVYGHLLEQERRQNERVDLLNQIERAPDIFPELLDVVRVSVMSYEASRERLPIIGLAIKETLRKSRHALDELWQGRLLVEPQRTSILFEQYEVSREIYATTGDRDTWWWTSEIGTKYLQANERAVHERHARVERVFLLEEDTEAIRDIMRKNDECGVTVMCVPPSDMARLPQRLKINVTIFADRGLFHRDDVNSSGETIHYMYSVNPDDLAEVRRDFDALKARTMSWRDFAEMPQEQRSVREILRQARELEGPAASR